MNTEHTEFATGDVARALDEMTAGERPSTIDLDTRRVLKFFDFNHLPPHLKDVSQHFHDLAWRMSVFLPASRERLKALDRLLEAKDAAIRARIGET